MIFPPFTNLTTERLLLRELQLTDAEQIFKIRSNERVNQFLDRAPAKSVKDALRFIKSILKTQKNGEGMMWVITLKDNPQLIGTVVYWHIVRERDEAEIGYEMLPDYFGKGIMQEAVSKVIEFGFKTMQLKTIVAHTKAGNLRSIKLLKKCGFLKMEEAEDGYLIYSLSVG